MASRKENFSNLWIRIVHLAVCNFALRIHHVTPHFRTLTDKVTGPSLFVAHDWIRMDSRIGQAPRCILLPAANRQALVDPPALYSPTPSPPTHLQIYVSNPRSHGTDLALAGLKTQICLAAAQLESVWEVWELV